MSSCLRWLKFTVAAEGSTSERCFCYRFCMRKSWCSYCLLLSLLPRPHLRRRSISDPARSVNGHGGDKWAEKTLHKLSVEEKVGQLFMIWCRASFLNVESPEYLQLRDAMKKYHVGSFAMTVHVDGPFLLRSEPYEAAELLNRLQTRLEAAVAVRGGFRAWSRDAADGSDELSARDGFRRRREAGRRRELSAASRRRKRAPSACTGISFRTPT